MAVIITVIARRSRSNPVGQRTAPEAIEEAATAFIAESRELTIVGTKAGAHVGARAELDAIADEVVQVVRLMDGLNRFRFANEPESLATWGSASNTFGPPRSGGKTVEGGKPVPSGRSEGAADGGEVGHAA